MGSNANVANVANSCHLYIKQIQINNNFIRQQCVSVLFTACCTALKWQKNASRRQAVVLNNVEIIY